MVRLKLNLTKVEGYLFYVKTMKSVIDAVLSRACGSSVSLTGKECEILANLMYHNDALKDIKNKKARSIVLFDYDTKLKIKENVSVTDSSFNNILSSLRRKKAIVDGLINDSIAMYCDDEIKIFIEVKLSPDGNK